MIVECPHCYRSVLPKEDNSCPSCRGNISEQSKTDPTKRRVTIRSRQKLPKICIHCGDSAVRDKAWIKKEETEASVAGKWLLGPLLSKFLFRKLRVIAIYLPICDRHCGEKIKAVHENFGSYQASFIVSKQFKDAMKNQE